MSVRTAVMDGFGAGLNNARPIDVGQLCIQHALAIANAQ